MAVVRKPKSWKPGNELLYLDSGTCNTRALPHYHNRVLCKRQESNWILLLLGECKSKGSTTFLSPLTLSRPCVEKDTRKSGLGVLRGGRWEREHEENNKVVLSVKCR